MYKVTVTAAGTSATASKECRTMKEAKSVKAKLTRMLKMPVDIEITRIGKSKQIH